MSVKTLKHIRESKGYSLYEMAKRLEMTLPAYIYLEDKGQSLRLDILIKALKISGLSLTSFWKMLENEAETLKITKKGRKPKEYK
jgi:transcriptional regulator with XRE-family HTH domain